jgi:MazG family protein
MPFSFEDLVAVMAHLRGVEGCPWDREQTHASLAPYLLEEAHETLDAIARGDPDALRGELGDVLLQVVFHAQIAHEAGQFDAAAVVDTLVHKLLARHPHVFGDLRLGSAREVLAHWEELKRREAPDRPIDDGVPNSLPALARAQKLVRRSGEGADDRTGAVAASAVRAACDAAIAHLSDGHGTRGADDREAHIGNLLLAVVGLAAAAGVDAEAALRRASAMLVERLGASR